MFVIVRVNDPVVVGTLVNVTVFPETTPLTAPGAKTCPKAPRPATISLDSPTVADVIETTGERLTVISIGSAFPFVQEMYRGPILSLFPSTRTKSAVPDAEHVAEPVLVTIRKDRVTGAAAR